MPGILTLSALAVFFACNAAAAPMRLPNFINSNGRRSFSAASRGISAQPLITNRLLTPSGRKASSSTFSEPGQDSDRVFLPFIGSGGTWKSVSEASAWLGCHVLSRAICSALAKDAKEPSFIGILRVYSIAVYSEPFLVDISDDLFCD